jgi:hypothetical protein
MNKCLILYLLNLLINYIKTQDSDNLVELKELLIFGDGSIIIDVKMTVFKTVSKMLCGLSFSLF